MFARHGHYAVDNGETYCHDTASFGVREAGDTVTGLQPTDYCSACAESEPDWEELTEAEFNRSYA